MKYKRAYLSRWACSLNLPSRWAKKCAHMHAFLTLFMHLLKFVKPAPADAASKRPAPLLHSLTLLLLPHCTPGTRKGARERAIERHAQNKSSHLKHSQLRTHACFKLYRLTQRHAMHIDTNMR